MKIQNVAIFLVVLSLLPLHLSHSVRQRLDDPTRVSWRVTSRVESPDSIPLQGHTSLLPDVDGKSADRTVQVDSARHQPSGQTEYPSHTTSGTNSTDANGGVRGSVREGGRIESGSTDTATGGSGSTAGSSSFTRSSSASSTRGSTARLQGGTFDSHHIRATATSSEQGLGGDPPRTMPPGLIYPTCMNPTGEYPCIVIRKRVS